MLGPSNDSNVPMIFDNQNRGLIPRLIQELFDIISLPAYEVYNTEIKVAVFEIYNEKINDLLADDPSNAERKVFDIKVLFEN